MGNKTSIVGNNHHTMGNNIIGGNNHHKMHLSEPWFALISLGLKKTEGRLNKGRFKELAEGDIIEWYNDDFKHRHCLTKIIKKINYGSFAEYLKQEGLDNCLPGITDIETGLSVYYKYFSKEDEKQFGVVAIQLIKI